MRARQLYYTLVLLLLVGAALPGAAAAVPLRAVGQDATGNDFLLRFDSASPGTVTEAALPVPAGVDLVALDYRPKTGTLFGVGTNSRLYRIYLPESSAPTVSLAAGTFATLGSAESVGFDFDPTKNVSRIVDEDNQNFRVTPSGQQVDGDPGTPGTQPDSPLNYPTGDPNAGQDPTVGGAAYSNNGLSASTTPLYAIDYQRDILVRQDPPNSGALHTVGALGADVGSNNGFDVPPGSSLGYLASGTSLYSVDLPSGAGTSLGTIDTTRTVRGLAGPPAMDMIISEYRTGGGSGASASDFR
jgi:hypothetical protein